MSGKQIVITILGIAVIAGCSWSFSAWLNHQSFNKKSEVGAKLGEQEVARYQIFKDLANEVISLRNSKDVVDDKNCFILDDADHIKSENKAQKTFLICILQKEKETEN